MSGNDHADLRTTAMEHKPTVGYYVEILPCLSGVVGTNYALKYREYSPRGIAPQTLTTPGVFAIVTETSFPIKAVKE